MVSFIMISAVHENLENTVGLCYAEQYRINKIIIAHRAERLDTYELS